MMLTKIKPLTLAETTALLRRHLGPLRSWSFFLSDNIRGRQSIAGVTLMPSRRLRNKKGAFCPVFSTTDRGRSLAALTGKLRLTSP